MSYTPLETIFHNAQKGSGYTRSKETTRAKTVLDSLAEKGWSKGYLKTALHNLDDNLLAGWPEELFQEYYMKETAQLHSTLEESLLKMGVKPGKVGEAVYVLKPLQNTCYTQKQLLDVALEYLLGFYKPIAPPDASHFLQPTVLSEWMPYHKKAIMNVSYSCRHTAIKRFEQQIESTFPKLGGKVFFHTTNWGGATNIMHMIDVTKSRMCLDFNYKPSFYASESVADAIEWGVKNSRKWQDEIAIIAFYLPQDFHKDFEFKDLTEDAEEWKWVVTSFRNCAKSHDVKEYDELHDFIYGPMLANPEYYNIEGPLLHRLPLMQLVAKTREATRYLYKCMKGAFVFRKLNTPA
jgi:hypothetical protein